MSASSIKPVKKQIIDRIKEAIDKQYRYGIGYREGEPVTIHDLEDGNINYIESAFMAFRESGFIVEGGSPQYFTTMEGCFVDKAGKKIDFEVQWPNEIKEY